MNRGLRLALQILLPVATLGLGVGALSLLVLTKPEAEKKARVEDTALVRVTTVGQPAESVTVPARGSVIPARQVNLQSEVAGRVIWKSPQLQLGSRFKKGQLLIRVDARDYAIAAAQQQASVEQAALQLTIEQSRKEIAKDEWAVIGEDGRATAAGRAVALREPQLKVAEVQLRAAEKSRDKARLALGRTTIRAPFDGIVTALAFDVGELVSPAKVLAKLVATDSYWVQVAVPVEKLPAISVPGVNCEAGEGAAVVVRQDLGREQASRSGQVIRLLGDLDPVGRMARLLVEIKDPYQPIDGGRLTAKGAKLAASKRGGNASTRAKGTGPSIAEGPLIASTGAQGAGEDSPRAPSAYPLLLGSYVDVQIEANVASSMFEIPRRAVRQGDKIYVYTSEGTLKIREIKPVWSLPHTVLVDKGVNTGERLVISRLAGAVDGMKLRVAQQGADNAVVGKR